MNCPRCRRVLEEGAVICHGCGTPIAPPETISMDFPAQVAETMPSDDDASGVRFAPLEGRVSFRGLLVHSAMGEGAMGAAYLASHRILQMPLVIKTFKTNAYADIFAEAHLAARVVSPYVVSVMDAGIESDIPFIIQRYVDGVDLAELIGYMQEARWRLPANTVCRMVIDAASGLHAIHQAGVIHRDVKPANLFLTGYGTTTVGDFGIAVDAAGAVGGQPLMGTPVFMAPEQWLQQETGRYTDIYSLGVTAHLLLTGQMPFTAASMRDLADAHLYKPYSHPAPTSPSEAYVFSVIERMLHKRPSDRYQTAEAPARVLKVVAEPPPQFVRTSEDETRVGPLRVTFAVADIADGEATVIVNAANSEMIMDIGVAAAMKRAAGASVEEEAMRCAPAAMGEVVWTDAGGLKARWVAHAVSAMSGAVCLQRCTLRVLLGAEVRRAESVLFPALGTGVGAVPMDLCAKLILEAVRTFASFQPEHVREVRIALFDNTALARWRTILRSI
jgi:O-acetyl-ADP-ribose deacetylase (regulator of RNase III)